MMLSMLASLALSATTAPVAACQPPNVLILFDISGSMAKPIAKFNQAVTAIDTVTAARDADIRFGLTVFPKPYSAAAKTGGYCDVSEAPAVTLGTGNAAAIKNYLASFGGPSGFNDTPIWQTLGAAATNTDLQDATRRNAVILVTDGQQDCFRFGDYNDVPDADPADNLYPDEVVANRADLVVQVQRLKALGVPVFVVGLGTGVDPLTLAAMAGAAGTQRSSSCNPQETNLSAADLCYFPASDTQSLEDALGRIVTVVKTEICNGIDDNCNGQIDEGLTQTCSSCNGTGTESCVDGTWQGCTVGTSPEVCDGIDNDCDGLVDQKPCMTACGPGTVSCNPDGTFSSTCVITNVPVETCNGIDDNCNGVIDEGCDCKPGDTRACGAGSCSGQESCTFGKWGGCTSSPPKNVAETCNGVDDDCNGKVDDGAICPPGQTCTAGTCVPTSTGSDSGNGSSSGNGGGNSSGSSSGNGGETTTSIPPAANAGNEAYLGSGLSRGCNAEGSGVWLAGLAFAFIVLRRRRA